MDRRYSVSEKVLQPILDYLGSKQYYEVHQLVKNLQEDVELITLPSSFPDKTVEDVIKEAIEEVEEK